jgi:hypothetical protein
MAPNIPKTLHYLTTSSLVCSFGDFLALAGAIGFTPLDFVLPALLWILVHKVSKPRMVLHVLIVVVYSIMGLLGAIGAIRFIITDSINYQAFANI